MAMQPEKGDKACECKHDRHQKQTAVWYDSTGWLHCLECKGWAKIKHVITRKEYRE